MNKPLLNTDEILRVSKRVGDIIETEPPGAVAYAMVHNLAILVAIHPVLAGEDREKFLELMITTMRKTFADHHQQPRSSGIN